jgi:hypothetical protein
MKTFLIAGGIFIIIFICIVPLPRKIKEYNIQKNGNIVSVVITYIPHCIGTKIKHFMKFRYAGQEFDKSIGCNFSDTHKVGETFNLRHIEGTDIFLFENEKIETEFISAGLLALFGIAFIVIGVRKK